MVNFNNNKNRIETWYKQIENVDNWYESLGILLDYYLKHQKIPSDKDIYKNCSVGDWLCKQRKMYSEGELPQVFVNLLNNIIPDWLTVET